MLRWCFTIAAMLLGAALVTATQGQSEAANRKADTKRPNIVFVSTNDQDAASLGQMPYTSGAFQDASKTFTNHTFAYPLCCPTRVTWLRGQYPHNHTIWTNTAEQNGGYRRFKRLGYNEENLATRLKASGYRTGMFGYYVNQTPYDGAEPGWNKFVGPGKTYSGGSLGTKNHGVRDRVISANAVRYANQYAGGNRPLFQWVSYYGPHWPYDHEPRFADAAGCVGVAPSGPGLDEDTDEELADKPAWVRERARMLSGLTDTDVARDYGARL